MAALSPVASCPTTWARPARGSLSRRLRHACSSDFWLVTTGCRSRWRGWRRFHRSRRVRLRGRGRLAAPYLGDCDTLVHRTFGLLLRAVGHDGGSDRDTSERVGGTVVLARALFAGRQIP